MHTSSFAWAGNCEGASSIAPKTQLHRPFGFWMLFDDTTRALCSNMPIDWFSHPLRQYGTEFHLSTDCEMWLHFHTPMPVFSSEYVCVCVRHSVPCLCKMAVHFQPHLDLLKNRMRCENHYTVECLWSFNVAQHTHARGRCIAIKTLQNAPVPIIPIEIIDWRNDRPVITVNGRHNLYSIEWIEYFHEIDRVTVPSSSRRDTFTTVITALRHINGRVMDSCGMQNCSNAILALKAIGRWCCCCSSALEIGKGDVELAQSTKYMHVNYAILHSKSHLTCTVNTKNRKRMCMCKQHNAEQMSFWSFFLHSFLFLLAVTRTNDSAAFYVRFTYIRVLLVQQME